MEEVNHDAIREANRRRHLPKPTTLNSGRLAVLSLLYVAATLVSGCSESGSGVIPNSVNGQGPTLEQPNDDPGTSANPESTGVGPEADLSGDILIPPNALELRVSAGPGELVLSWDEQAAGSVTRIEQYNNQTRETTTLVDLEAQSPTQFTIDINSFLFDWQASEFILHVCQQEQCLSSYSVPVDLLQGASGTMLAAPQANDYDLYSSAITSTGSGNVVIVGAPGSDAIDPFSGEPVFDAGKAQLFFEVDGQWWHGAELEANEPTFNSQLGAALASDQFGDIVVAGAPYDSNQQEQAGSVFIFQRAGETWIQQQRLTAQRPGILSLFGSSVAISNDGNTIAVGAPGDSAGTSNSGNETGLEVGSVTIFSRDDSTGNWLQSDYLQGQQPGNAARFGQSVELDDEGRVLVVSAPGETSDTVDSITPVTSDEAGNNESGIPKAVVQGAIYVFTADISDTAGDQSAGTFLQTQRLVREDAVSDTRYAVAISLSATGDALLASSSSLPSIPGRGAMLEKPQSEIEIYSRDPNGLFQRTNSLLPAGLHGYNSRLSLSINASGDVIAAGIDNPDSVSNTVTIFTKDDSIWQTTNLIENPKTQSNNFAANLHMSDDASVLFISAETESAEGETPSTASGTLYLY